MYCGLQPNGSTTLGPVLASSCIERLDVSRSAVSADETCYTYVRMHDNELLLSMLKFC